MWGWLGAHAPLMRTLLPGAAWVWAHVAGAHAVGTHAAGAAWVWNTRLRRTLLGRTLLGRTPLGPPGVWFQMRHLGVLSTNVATDTAGWG